MSISTQRDAQAAGLLWTILQVSENDRYGAIAAADAAIDILAPRAPELTTLMDEHADDARWWVEFAPDRAKVAMFAALMRHINEFQINTIGARKRALVTIWNTLDENDRAAFLERVDPAGGAKG